MADLVHNSSKEPEFLQTVLEATKHISATASTLYLYTAFNKDNLNNILIWRTIYTTTHDIYTYTSSSLKDTLTFEINSVLIGE